MNWTSVNMNLDPAHVLLFLQTDEHRIDKKHFTCSKKCKLPCLLFSTTLVKKLQIVPEYKDGKQILQSATVKM